MEIKAFINNEFSENCYVIYDKSSKEAAIIDPGMRYDQEKQNVASFVKSNSLSIKYILLTHSHVDHIFGSDFCVKEFGIEVYGNLEDQLGLPAPQVQSEMFGVGDSGFVPSITKKLEEGDELTFGNVTVKVIDCPGHSHHGLCFYCPNEKVVFTGDVLFNLSIGRSDFGSKFGGNGERLVTNIKNKLLILPDEVEVYPGHGPKTTIGFEKIHNPFLS